LEQTNRNQKISYAGRTPAAAPATGYKWAHDKELAKLLKDAFYI
jgi:2-oxoglutarate dehydrogenase complex dehydrogenase (E1) component-like enzyme